MSTKSEKIGEIVAEHHGREGPLLPILHDVQAEFGCVDEDAEVLIAKGLNLSRADVHGVVSFYHDFSDKADGRPVVQVCRAEAIDGVQLDPLARSRLRTGHQRLDAAGLAGFCAADLHDRAAVGLVAEVMVEADHPVHVRPA